MNPERQKGKEETLLYPKRNQKVVKTKNHKEPVEDLSQRWSQKMKEAAS